jgi:uncharacterized membrane protein YfcA
VDPQLTTLQYLILALGALLGSTVSGITGVGGGMVFLPFLVFTVGAKYAVPYLSMLLLVANVSRAYFSRQGIDWNVFRHFCLGAIPGAAVGALVYTWLDPFWITKALGVYLVAYVILSFTKNTWPKTSTLRSISISGVPAGFVSAVVGGSGPVVVPWLLRYGLVKEAFIGTEAVGASAMHIVKLAVWGGRGLITAHDIILLLPLSVLMIAGSYFGTALVTRMPVRIFRTILIFALAVIGLRFLLF